MTRPAVIPIGAWPALMPADLAAGYVGERSVESFLSRVGLGRRYPPPRFDEPRGKRWLKRDLDIAIGNTTDHDGFDAADVL